MISRKIARWTDDWVRIPGVGIKIGLDPIIGLWPVLGDGISLLLSAFIIVDAARVGVPPRMIARMGFNILIDLVLGGIPLIGDVFDMMWKANKKNAAILDAHLEAAGAGSNSSSWIVAILIFGILALILFGLIWFLRWIYSLW